MAASVYTNFKIYDELINARSTEILRQVTDILNQRSGGALLFSSNEMQGHFVKEALINAMSGLVTRRDPTSVAALTPTAVTMGEMTRVKVDRHVIPYATTYSALRKSGITEAQFSNALGQQEANEIIKNAVNSMLRCAVAAISGNAAVTLDVSRGGSTPAGITAINPVNLINTRALFGDAANDIVTWVMHSRSLNDLMLDHALSERDPLVGLTVIQGQAATLGIPVIQTDSPSLKVAGSPDTYYVLGLTRGAVTCEESEERRRFADQVVAAENASLQIKHEWALTLGVKGYSWDTANGGISPTDAALATSSNWDKWATDDKNTAGVVLKHDVRSGADAS